MGTYYPEKKAGTRFRQWFRPFQASKLGLVADCRAKLKEIYESSRSKEAKLSAKLGVFAEMEQNYTRLKKSWGGYSGYDQFFNQPLNNAVLASVTLYTQWVPAFNALLEQEGGDLPRFYQRVSELAQSSETERSATLNRLLPNNEAAPMAATN